MIEKVVSFFLTTVESESEEFFTELFLGAGGWLGFVLIMSIMFLVAIKSKYAGILFIPVSLMLGIFYLNNLAVNNDLMWCAILSFFAIPFFFLTIFKGKSL